LPLVPPSSPAATASGERVLDLAAVQDEGNRVGREAPVGAGGDALPQRLDETDLAVAETELDAGSRQGVRARPLPFHAGSTHQDGEPCALIELHRIAAGGEVAPVDGHLPAAPHPVVPLEAHPVSHDDVRLTR